jgi:colicin import membrane protein
MSTVSTTRPPRSPSDEPDPFRYGWRFVRITRPDGTEELDQVPLTLEDVLHPEEGDFIVQTDAHDDERAYLKSVFKAQLKKDRTAAVLSDCRVDWCVPGVRPLGPDVAVFFGVSRRIDWSTFDVDEEGARPALVIEITSPDTRKNDVGIKVDYYHRAGVPQYVIADVTFEDEEERRVELIEYRHGPRSYRRFKPNKQGRIWLSAVNLWLGLTRDPLAGYTRVACFDPETGEEVGDYTVVSQALAAETTARAQAEKARAKAEKARARAEKQAAAEAEARTKAEQHAAAEAEARTKAEARIRELEAAVKRLEQGS